MKVLFRVVVILNVAGVLGYSCSNEEHSKQLADRACSTCHSVPDPGLLDRKSWRQVLPEMAFRMGLHDPSFKLSIPPRDSVAVYSTIPLQPLVTEEEWEEISEYYLDQAPDSLPGTRLTVDDHLALFNARTLILPGHALPMVSMIKVDTANLRTWMGTLSSDLFIADADGTIRETGHLASPPSSMVLHNDRTAIISVLGILEPNEQSLGALLKRDASGAVMTLIDSLQRPVDMVEGDLNRDGQMDYVVCDFGNYTGALLAFENLGNGLFKRHTLMGRAGARKAVLRDVTNDGLDDIVVLMAQGNEEIVLLINGGSFGFSAQSLLRFSPVQGSSYFDLIDWNHDGHPDILYTNGDNGDFSNILKPYHGVSVFVNDGHLGFTQALFQPMNGASKAIARDFDQDGDLDIAAISFFPDFERHPSYGFLYLENTASGIKLHTLPIAATGRWLVMDAADLDRDGDCDLLLGAFDYDFQVPPALADQWRNKKTAGLILYNATQNTVH